jgi:hypothetical protein
MSAHNSRFTMLFVLGAATAAACGGDDTGSTATGAGGGGTTSSVTVTSVATTVATGSSTTVSTGTGDPMAICDEGRTKLDMCGPGGAGGAGGGGNPVSAECDVIDQCEAACAIDSSCQQIMFNDEHYSTCIYCCNNPMSC